MTETIVLDPFRKLGTVPFRIEWFGDVSYAGRFGGPSPLINVVLARGHQGQWIRGVEEGGPPITAAIPIGYLRLLRVGDVWALGQRVGRDSGAIRLTFPDVLVGDTTTDIRPAGLPLANAEGDPSYLLPFAEFDAHRSHTGAFCACVTLPEGIALVVPCMELIRFYFGASGALLKRLFSGAFALDNLYTSARCSPSTGIGNVTLVSGLPYASATSVARIAFDRRARQAASWISKSGVAATANGERYYPKTTFPFAGRTDLTVDGQWLNSEPTRVFLIQRVVQCTYPFPFKRLYVRSGIDVAGNQRSGKPKSNRRAKSQEAGQDAHQHTLLEGYVTRALLPLAVDVGDEEEMPFPDLVGKPVHRMAGDPGHGGARAGGNSTSELAAGATLSSDGKREAEVTAAEAPGMVVEHEPKEVERFREAFRELVESGKTTAMLIPPVPGESTKSKSPFLRGDLVVSDADEKSRGVWCARILDGDGRTGSHWLAVVKPPADVVGSYRVALMRVAESSRGGDEALREAWRALAAIGWIPAQSPMASVFKGGRIRRLEAFREFLRGALCGSPTG